LNIEHLADKLKV